MIVIPTMGAVSEICCTVGTKKFEIKLKEFVINGYNI